MSEYAGRQCYVEGYSADENDTYTFIKFGKMSVSGEDNNPYQVDCAILEADDGNILEVAPSDIKFVD